MRRLTVIVVNFLLVLSMFGFLISHLCYGSEETVNANPRLIYWPPTQIRYYYNQLIIYCPQFFTRSLAWSPSGEYLVLYGRDGEEIGGPGPTGAGIIFFFNINSRQMNRTTLELDPTSNPGDILYRFAISPDGTKIFFAKSTIGSHSGVFSVNLDGSGLTQIAEVNSSSTCSPVAIDVSHDGAFLVYSEYFIDYNIEPETPYHSNLWKVNLETMEKSLVKALHGNDSTVMITSVKFSPNDDKLAFTTCSGIYLVNLNDTNLTRIASVADNTIAAHIEWSNNGTMLMFSEIGGITGEMSPSIAYDNMNVTAINVDGSNKRVIYISGCAATFSPVDNSLIAFISTSFCASYLWNLRLPTIQEPDSDGDGLTDNEEFKRPFFNPLDPTDPQKDYDNDGLTNLEEWNMNVAINVPDTDGDGLSDGVEVKVFKTDPLKADTDGDGVSDGLEAAATGLNAFVSVLPEGWIRIQLEWSNKTMYVTTNSSVLGVVFNSTSMALSISVGGPDGTLGIANITVPISMINSLSAIRVTLDNQPVDFTINQVGNYAQIYVQYHHSFHELTTHLQAGGASLLPGIAIDWWLILIIVEVVVAVAAVLIFLRKMHQIKRVQTTI